MNGRKLYELPEGTAVVLTLASGAAVLATAVGDQDGDTFARVNIANEIGSEVREHSYPLTEIRAVAVVR